MSQTVACADAVFIWRVGAIRTAAVYIDKIKGEPGKRQFYQQLLAWHSKSERLEQKAARLGVPELVKDLLVSSSAAEWQIEMNAKGSLAQMADVCCAMFGRYMDDIWREPWDVIQMRYAIGHTPCVVFDLRENVRAWLEHLYSRGDPDRYP